MQGILCQAEEFEGEALMNLSSNRLCEITFEIFEGCS